MSLSAIPIHVALVDDSHTILPADLQEVAGALNEQVLADFTPAWHVRATVGVYDHPPAGTWAIRLRTNIGEPGALGYHSDSNRQPYSLVDVDDGNWTVTTSHELLEMIADPWGLRMHTAKRPLGVDVGSYRVRYLLEVCDPCEAFTYEVGGVLVSDFLLPDWYRTSPRATDRYSFTGALKAPREVADGGYVSWQDPTDKRWFQVFNQGGELSLSDLGTFDADYALLREWTDMRANVFRELA
jgi:hypothetical protein